MPISMYHIPWITLLHPCLHLHLQHNPNYQITPHSNTNKIQGCSKRKRKLTHILKVFAKIFGILNHKFSYPVPVVIHGSLHPAITNTLINKKFKINVSSNEFNSRGCSNLTCSIESCVADLVAIDINNSREEEQKLFSAVSGIGGGR
ncbi:hypothetical protein L1887_30279 [Cichorium endivia]|nr:hypothetical protein L1887_30279 [Cichorium endivia]